MKYEKPFSVNDLISSGGVSALFIEDGERLITGGFATDLLSHGIGNAASGDAWLTVLSNPNIIAPASIADVTCIIVCDSTPVTDALKAKCEAMGISLLSTEMPITDMSVYLYKLQAGLL
ncbi:MAG: hypothetical protein IJB44_04860 [Clostridia bacterium]|nr:hypothetical protein [Clostridia bacterium]